MSFQKTLLVVGLFVFLQICCTNTTLVNKAVVRNIDLTSQIARHTVDVTFDNTGSNSEDHFHVTVENDLAGKLSYLVASNKEETQNYTVTQDTSSKNPDHVTYLVKLSSPIAASASLDVRVKLAFVHSMEPLPEEITQNEKQLVVYKDNHYWYSPYKTNNMRTKVKLASQNVISTSELSPSSTKGDIVTFGAYKNVDAFSKSPLSVHFENTRPFLTVDYVQRWIELSHWGNVAVEEQYKIHHGGAKLKGSFSRYEYQVTNPVAGVSIPLLHQHLPEVAADVYYRDDIGNISTSFLRPGNPQLLELRPRFPLFGGWKTEFTVGYNLPSAPYLSTDYDDSSVYVLNTTFVAEWQEELAIDEQVVKVILPEGATDIETQFPFSGVEVTIENHVTYLDLASVGRPVVVCRKRNAVNEHNQYFQVKYRFSKSSLLFEPLLLVGAFFTIFASIIALVRVQLSIHKEKPKVVNPEVVSALGRLRSLYAERVNLHNRYEDALTTYIQSSDSASWEKERKSITASLNKLRKEVAQELGALAKLDSSLGGRMQELENKQSAKEDSQAKTAELTIRFKVNKDIKSDKYKVEHDKLKELYHSAKEELDQEFDEIFE